MTAQIINFAQVRAARLGRRVDPADEALAAMALSKRRLQQAVEASEALAATCERISAAIEEA